MGQVVDKKNQYMTDRARIIIPLSTDEDIESQRG